MNKQTRIRVAVVALGFALVLLAVSSTFAPAAFASSGHVFHGVHAHVSPGCAVHLFAPRC